MTACAGRSLPDRPLRRRMQRGTRTATVRHGWPSFGNRHSVGWGAVDHVSHVEAEWTTYRTAPAAPGGASDPRDAAHHDAEADRGRAGLVAVQGDPDRERLGLDQRDGSARPARRRRRHRPRGRGRAGDPPAAPAAPGPRSPHTDVFSPDALRFFDDEHSATWIGSIELLVVPGLLQTEDYARTVMGVHGIGAERAERLSAPAGCARRCCVVRSRRRCRSSSTSPCCCGRSVAGR